MKKLVFALAVLALAAPAFAQGRSVDVTAHFAWVDLNGDEVIVEDPAGDYSLGTFETDTGYGGAINVFITRRLSAEVAMTEVKPEGRIQYGGQTAVGELDMLPITGMIQYHFNPEGKLDFYVAGGIAYVLFDEFKSSDPGDLDFGQIDFEDDYGSAWGAGASFGLMGGLAVVADAKYVLTSNKVTTNVGETQIDISPLILTVGVQIQF